MVIVFSFGEKITRNTQGYLFSNPGAKCGRQYFRYRRVWIALDIFTLRRKSKTLPTQNRAWNSLIDSNNREKFSERYEYFTRRNFTDWASAFENRRISLDSIDRSSEPITVKCRHNRFSSHDYDKYRLCFSYFKELLWKSVLDTDIKN